VGLRIYIDEGRAPAFLIVLAFLVTFGLTRLYTRLGRVRGWGSGHAGGIHLHHMVFGIVFILVAGFLGLALRPGHPWLDVLGVLFGVGAALTLDEFALWLYLEDVYWHEEGRTSIDAVILATMLATLALLGVTPFGITGHSSRYAVAIALAFGLVCSLVAVLKGKIFLGLIGIFIPLLAPVAAIRLARPNSPWARRRYAANGRKLAKAVARERKRRARKERLRNWIGGTPSEARAP
jgi:hypothetical protein